MPILKIKDIKPEYAAKEVRDASGNVLSWDQVLKHYPDYEIEVDEEGKPVQYKDNKDYYYLKQKVENDNKGPYAATKWLLGQQVALPLGALGVVTAPVVATVGGIAGGVLGDVGGHYLSNYLYDNPDKPIKLFNTNLEFTPRTATRLGGSLVGGIAGGAGAYTTQQNVVKPYLISREIKRMPLTGSNELPSNVGWGPKQTITVSHKSDSPKPLVLLNPERYDVVNKGANPLGIWYQGKLGIPRTVNTGATLEKATKAQRARKLFDDRPFTHKGDLTLEKPLVTIGEVPNKSTLSHQAEKLGADGIIYNGVYDNGYNNNQVILSFKQHNNPHLGIKAYRGGNPNGLFFSTDPNYASQYGTLRQYDLIARNPEITETPLLFPKDVVAQDMYIDDLIKGDYSKDVIIGKDAITNEGLTPSTGYELIVRNPDNITGTQNMPFNLVNRPGYQLKILMKGSPLEKAISKNGTINLNSLNAQLKNASKVEQDVINKVLNERFADQRFIDYNELRKAVQEELITYSKHPKIKYETYGMDRLGFKLHYDPVDPKLSFTTEAKPQTFTFESKRIPIGNNKHYDETTLGHSRTYTTPDEPEVLHVMESQSDWGQSKLTNGPYVGTSKYLNDVDSYKQFINGHKKLLKKMQENPDDYREGAIEKQIANIKHHERILNDILKTRDIQVQYLHDNYLRRQLQENMKFAKENGQTKMRYPTTETAAKIEGYKKTYPEPEYSMLKQQNEAYQRSFENGAISYDRYLELTDRVNKRLREIQEQGSYSSQHQTILKKYADFPKMFNKLFKDKEVRTVTDPKGNSWYEVDVPENYLNTEWQYKSGGKLTPIKHFK